MLPTETNRAIYRFTGNNRQKATCYHPIKIGKNIEGGKRANENMKIHVSLSTGPKHRR